MTQAPTAAQRDARTAALHACAKERILVMDGAFGTMIQDRKLGEADYRGARFAKWKQDLKGNNDLLNLTQPEIVKAIHAAYFAAGADIAETNTFNANAVSQADYGLEDVAYELNLAGARLARGAADEAEALTPGRTCFVTGVLGPTSKTASLSPDVNDPAARNITFDALVDTYRSAASGLVDGGADMLLIETVFDTLNAKAALFAIDDLFETLGYRLPIMISGTITDLSGRTLSGQTVEAFWNSVRHVEPFSIGLNCALGAAELRAYVAELSRVADTLVSAHPNAGLPNEFGEYDETPEVMAKSPDRMGGSRPRQHPRRLLRHDTRPHPGLRRRRRGRVPPRDIPVHPRHLRLSGLEPFELPVPNGRFVNVGERTNVTGIGQVQAADPGRRLRPLASRSRASRCRAAPR